MFSVYNDKGFELKFKNNYVVNVRFDAENHDNSFYKGNGIYSKIAKIKIWIDKGLEKEIVTEKYCEYKGIPKPDDNVLLFQTPECLADILKWVKAQETVRICD